jgi:hypothetical protein
MPRLMSTGLPGVLQTWLTSWAAASPRTKRSFGFVDSDRTAGMPLRIANRFRAWASLGNQPSPHHPIVRCANLRARVRQTACVRYRSLRGLQGRYFPGFQSSRKRTKFETSESRAPMSCVTPPIPTEDR